MANQGAHKKQQLAAEPVDKVNLGYLVKLANQHPKLFGEEVLVILIAWKKKADIIIVEFRRRKLHLPVSQNLDSWLQGDTQTAWNADYMDALLEVLDDTPKRFLEVLNQKINGVVPAKQVASRSVTPQPAPPTAAVATCVTAMPNTKVLEDEAVPMWIGQPEALPTTVASPEPSLLGATYFILALTERADNSRINFVAFITAQLQQSKKSLEQLETHMFKVSAIGNDPAEFSKLMAGKLKWTTKRTQAVVNFLGLDEKVLSVFFK